MVCVAYASFGDIHISNLGNYVNERFDITDKQSAKLREIKDELGIPPSAIIRLALNTFLPKLRDENFRYGGIKELWNNNKF